MAQRKNSRAYKKARREFRAACAEANVPCWMDGQDIDYDAAFDDYSNDDRFELDHYYPVEKFPELEEDPANFRASHALCNNRRSDSTVTKTLVGTLSRDWTKPWQEAA